MEQITDILDAAGLASQIILESGGETYRAEETAERMCRGLGAKTVDVLALPTGLMMTLTDQDKVTYSRLVRVHARTIDLDRLDRCNAVSRHVAEGKLTAREALRELTAIHAPARPSAWKLVLASAFSAAFFTVMLSGTWLDFFVSFFCGALLQLVLFPLSRRRVPMVLSNMIAGALATLLALCGTLVYADLHLEPIISGAIMPLLPGLATTNAIRDTIRGDLVSGGARVVEAVLSAITLAAGIGLMLSMWGGLVK